MGSRASYIIIEHSAITAYSEHWGAQTVPQLIARGPAETVSHIRDLPPVNWLFDTDWAEGGILVDVDARTLIFWGGENIDYSAYLRRLFLPVLGRIWHGWSVSWATRGIVDFAEYPGVARSLGIDPASVVGSGAGTDWHRYPESVVRAPTARRWNDTLVTVKWEDGRVSDYILDQIPPVYLMFGAPLLDVLRDREPDAPPREDGGDTYHATPKSGAFADLAEYTLWVWDSSTINPVHQECVAQAWPGWRIAWHIDGVAHQVALSGRDPMLVTPPIAHVGAELLNELAGGDARFDAAQFAKLMEECPDPATTTSAPKLVCREPSTMSEEQRRALLLRLVTQVARE